MEPDIVLMLKEYFAEVLGKSPASANRIGEWESIVAQTALMVAERKRLRSEVASWRAAAHYGLQPLNADAGRYLDEAVELAAMRKGDQP